MDPVVSIILPIHNERDNLAPLFEELSRAMSATAYEIVAVDDGSTDGSRAELERIAGGRDNVRIVCLPRRRGQSAAIMAGADHARAAIVATLDADGQNDPAELPPLLGVLLGDAGLGAVVGYRTRRADGRWKRWQSRIANAVRNRITGDRVRDTGCALKVMRRAWVERLPRFDGMHRFLPTLLRMAGATVLELPVTHRPRRYGRSKYGAWNRAWHGLRDAFGVRWLARRRIHYDFLQELR